MSLMRKGICSKNEHLPDNSLFACLPSNQKLSYEWDFIKPKRNPLRFSGNIFVLTGSYTFSTAADFAATIKDFSIGTIVGDETGGLPACYGDVFKFSLPNSGLEVRVSHKYSVRPSGQDTGRGVIPDYEVKPGPKDLITGEDRVMAFVLDLIRNIR